MDSLTRHALKHDAAAGLLPRIRAGLAAFGPEDTVLSVSQLAALDQFHTRGLAATADIAEAGGLEEGVTVLDLGCGIGGPARYLAANHGVKVVGIDLSPSFVDVARYLSQRCDLLDRTVFHVGDALDPPIEDGSVDRVFLLHVAMNINDRAALYRSIRRVLKPGGKLATYDVVERDGGLHFPVPWSEAPPGSHLLTEDETRDALVEAGFRIETWRDDTRIATQWFAAVQAGGPPPTPNLGLVLGEGFPGMTGNLARNLREGRAGILVAVAGC